MSADTASGDDTSLMDALQTLYSYVDSSADEVDWLRGELAAWGSEEAEECLSLLNDVNDAVGSVGDANEPLIEVIDAVQESVRKGDESDAIHRLTDDVIPVLRQAVNAHTNIERSIRRADPPIPGDLICAAEQTSAEHEFMLAQATSARTRLLQN